MPFGSSAADQTARFFTVSVCLICVGLPLSGCQKPAQPLAMEEFRRDYDRPLPPGEFALRKLTDPAEYPNFADSWYLSQGVNLREAVRQSIEYMGKPSSKKYYPVGPITHEDTLASLHLFLEILGQADRPEKFRALIEENFDVYISVGCDDRGTVLFTGYYSPIFDGSPQRTDEFRYPLHRLPPDFQKDAAGDPIGGPWRTRGEIEQGDLLSGSELVWLADRFEAFVISVQGSGFIKMPDGSLLEVGYAGHNGHEYTSIRRLMEADGVIDRYSMSLDAMIRHFKKNPADLDVYLRQNERYIFFREASGGPFGCLGRPVSKMYSIATDKGIFPRASLAFIDTSIPDVPGQSWRNWRSFVLDQDRGAAIRAPGRCDIYMGIGPDAGKKAGFTLSEGKLYYLVKKEGASARGDG